MDGANGPSHHLGRSLLGEVADDAEEHELIDIFRVGVGR